MYVYPFIFSAFFPSSMPSQKLLAFRVPLIYIYENKLIEQDQSNLLTSLSAIQAHHRPRCKIFCKCTPFYFLIVSLIIYVFDNILKLRNHFINSSDSIAKDNCHSNYLTPFSALYGHLVP